MTPSQLATVILAGLALGAIIFGLILGTMEWLRGRDDVRFHADDVDLAVAIAARSNLLRALGYIVLGLTDLALCIVLIARVIIAPTVSHPWIAVIIDIQAAGFLLLIVGEWRTRQRIERLSAERNGK